MRDALAHFASVTQSTRATTLKLLDLFAGMDSESREVLRAALDALAQYEM